VRTICTLLFCPKVPQLRSTRLVARRGQKADTYCRPPGSYSLSQWPMLGYDSDTQEADVIFESAESVSDAPWWSWEAGRQGP
jgi:hypothetical protein